MPFKGFLYVTILIRLVSECDFPFVSDGVYVDYCVVDPKDDYWCPTAWNVANNSLIRKR